MVDRPIVIAGGGIAGLAAGLCPWQGNVQILEQAQVLNETGAALQLGPNAARALQKLGAWHAVAPHTSSPPEIHLRDGLSGGLLKRLKLGKNFTNRFGNDYRVCLRADLHQALFDVAMHKPNLSIILNRKIVGVKQSAQSTLVTLQSGETIKTSALIAADGVNSNLRQQLFANAEARSIGHDHYRALLANMPTHTGLALDCINLWLFPHGHVVHYPAGRDQKLNLVFITPTGKTPAQHYATACDSLRLLVEKAGPTSLWPGLYVQPLPHWNIGNTLLIGDAAHATLPYLAQGAAMALEDAAALSQCLYNDSVPNAFQKLSERRQSRTFKLHHKTITAGKNYHASGITRSVGHAALRYMPEQLLWQSLRWLYQG